MSSKGTNEFDKILARFSKYILGVRSKASTFTVYSEFGLFPMIISVIISCVNVWIHTVKSSSDSLISQAYWEHFNNHSLKSMLLSFVKNILTELSFSHLWNNQATFNTSSLIKCIKAKLKKKVYINFGTNI